MPSHYLDGTAIHAEDFPTTPYPNPTSASTSVAAYRLMWSEIDYYKMTPPSMSCTSTILPANNIVWRKTGQTTSYTSVARPVVCKGRNIITILLDNVIPII